MSVLGVEFMYAAGCRSFLTAGFGVVLICSKRSPSGLSDLSRASLRLRSCHCRGTGSSRSDPKYSGGICLNRGPREVRNAGRCRERRSGKSRVRSSPNVGLPEGNPPREEGDEPTPIRSSDVACHFESPHKSNHRGSCESLMKAWSAAGRSANRLFL